MKYFIVIFISLMPLVSFSQEKGISSINKMVKTIESDTELLQKEFDLPQITAVSTDGGGILKIWTKDNQIYKIVEEVGLSYGSIKTIIYLNKGIPIKITETEYNFELNKDNEIDYSHQNEVFRAEYYIFNWENDESKIIKKGKRKMSDDTCSIFEYELIIERAMKI